ncbi:hypothetical protein VNI00_011279 [Paramarasmius palmivorus]|uniref:Clr5 domain-containing protein n=1 Tax=Paramarasmius palmivorus TaxID=297713 RepID=A0AAW0CD12_9AGAR
MDNVYKRFETNPENAWQWEEESDDAWLRRICGSSDVPLHSQTVELLRELGDYPNIEAWKEKFHEYFGRKPRLDEAKSTSTNVSKDRVPTPLAPRSGPHHRYDYEHPEQALGQLNLRPPPATSASLAPRLVEDTPLSSAIPGPVSTCSAAHKPSWALSLAGPSPTSLRLDLRSQTEIEVSCNTASLDNALRELLNSKNSEISQLQDEKSSLAAENDQLQEQLNTIQALILVAQRLTDTTNALDAERAEGGTLKQGMEEKLESLAKELADERARVIGFEQVIEGLNGEISQLPRTTRSHDHHVGDKTAMKAEVENLEALLQKAWRENTELHC